MFNPQRNANGILLYRKEKALLCATAIAYIFFNDGEMKMMGRKKRKYIKRNTQIKWNESQNDSS